MSEKIKIKYPIIVEGRYDKSTLSSIFDAVIITTNGFSVFNSKEKKTLIKKLAENGGIILLTDSDAGGRQIRSFLAGFLPKNKIFHLYIPEIQGKEKRKTSPSKAGLLGVEGMSAEILKKVLLPFFCNDESDEECKAQSASERLVTKLDFYNDGFSGGDGASQRRDKLAHAMDLPVGMSAKALIDAINLIYGYEKYLEFKDGVLENCTKK
jgi:ribonuclease M5